MIANAAIFVLFLLNGMRIARRDIVAGIANWRFLVPLVVVGVRSDGAGRAGARLDRTFLTGPAVALGFLYLGTLPVDRPIGNLLHSLAGGNVALSVVGAALLNILGVFVTVPLFLALGGSGSGAVGMEVIGKIMLLLILPFAIGQMVQGCTRFIESTSPRSPGSTASPFRRRFMSLSRARSSRASGRASMHRLGGDRRAGRGLPAARQCPGRLAGGRRASPPHGDRIAFLFAGAQKSAAVGAPLATILFPPEEAGFIVIALLLYHFFQLVVAAPIASRLACVTASAGWRRLWRTDHQKLRPISTAPSSPGSFRGCDSAPTAA